MKPFLTNKTQSEILFTHDKKIEQNAIFWKQYYDNHDPIQYWAYGIPHVIKEYQKIGGKFSPWAWVLGALATLCSKEYVSYSGVII